MQTYRETVYRYRIFRHEDLPETHKKAYRDRGIDPDTVWSLLYSFNNRKDAEEALAYENERALSFQTFKLEDAGEETVIDRPMW